MANLKFKLLLSTVFLVSFPVGAKAQFPAGYGWVLPRESQAASVSQKVGVTEVTITYHRPSAKGRTIWGCQTGDMVPKPSGVYSCLVPNNQVWRAGANEATTISFSTDVRIEGQPLAAGVYGLFMIPGDAEWTIIFNKRSKQWGAFAYKETDDMLRVKVAPQLTTEPLERLEYNFPVVSNEGTQVALRWEKMKIPFNVTVDSAKQSTARARTAFDPASGYFAADYYYQNRINLDEALKWINAAIAFDENGGNFLLKAKILSELKRHAEAIEAGGRALSFYRSKNLTKAAETVQAIITEWEKLKKAKE